MSITASHKAPLTALLKRSHAVLVRPLKLLARAMLLAVTTAVVAVPAPVSAAQAPAAKTQIVLLGTGDPDLSGERSGLATAIIVNHTPYLVDFGPGVVSRAAAARARGIAALDPRNLTRAFVTHLHSDHTVGYPDLVFTPWVAGRRRPLEIYGPRGLEQMTQNVLAGWREDIAVRSGPLAAPLYAPGGYRVTAREIAPGVVYRDANVTVHAFNVSHGAWGARAFGYRFQTADRRIVISGDTAPVEAVVRQCNGCDVLIHEVYTEAGYLQASPAQQRLLREYHSSSRQVAELATRARPKLLILHHQSYQSTASDEEVLNREMRAAYRGRFVSGHDLDVY